MGEPKGEEVRNVTPGDSIRLPDGKWWVFHVGCSQDWRSEPFDTKEQAEEYRDTLVDSSNSCPGCDGPTPDANNYTVVRIV